MPITERITMKVKGEVSDWSPDLKALLLGLKQQEGYLRTRWGPITEDMSTLELLIGWESKEAQAKFQSSPSFNSLLGAMKAYQATDPTVYFVSFVPNAPAPVIDADFVQMVTFTDVDGVAEEKLRAYGEHAATMQGCTGATGGYRDGGKDTFVAVVGWQTREASQDAEAGGRDVLLAAGGSVESHHVNFKFPVKGFSAVNKD